MPEGYRLDPSILREYDIRGIVPDTLNAAAAGAIGRAFGSILRDRGGTSAAVGYDGRLTSPELEAALVEGLSATGVDVTRIGLGPTPMLYYAERTLGVDAGLMVTGSHNPPDYNGIKLVVGGKPFFAEDIQLPGERAAAGDFAEGDGQVAAPCVLHVSTARTVRVLEPRPEPLKIAWAAGSRAAGGCQRE